MRIPLFLFLFALLVLASPSAAAEPGFAPSPEPSRIVLNPGADPSTQQLITWRTDALTPTGSVEYQPVMGGPSTTVDATSGLPVSFPEWTYASVHHTARLGGLTPGTAYRYRVGTGEHWSEWFTFETARSDQAPWTMIYFGDAQNNLDVAWKPVTERAFDHVPDAKLALHAGDLINRSSNDDEWGHWFEGVKGHAERINQFVVTGNHERSGDLLSVQFGAHFATAGNGPALADSTVYYSDYQGVRLIAIDGNGTAINEQLAFLENALATNPHPWTVVSFHQPIFSGAARRDNVLNRLFLQPILEEYEIDLILQGHDHVYARGMPDANIDSATGLFKPPVYTVTVAGPKYYELAPAEDNNWTQNGATRVAAYGQTSTYQPITFDGNTLTYRSYIAAKGPESTATGEPGDLLDAFTITRLPDGTKLVGEGEVPPDLGPDPKPRAVTPKVRIRRLVRNRARGTARLVVVTNLPGRIVAGGRGTPIRRVVRRVRARKPVVIPLRTNVRKTRQLRRRGRGAVRVRVRFQPRAGKAREINRRVVLVRMRR